MEGRQPIHTKIWSLDESMVRYAPDAPGVYALWREGQVIYYGRASGEDATIKSCLIEHISGTRGATTRGATHYSWEITRISAAREVELLSEFWSSFRRFPIGNQVEATSPGFSRRVA
jgi:hypothetical protein